MLRNTKQHQQLLLQLSRMRSSSLVAKKQMCQRRTITSSTPAHQHAIPEQAVAHLNKEDVEVIKNSHHYYHANHIPLSHSALRNYGEPYTDTKLLESVSLFREEPVRVC